MNRNRIDRTERLEGNLRSWVAGAGARSRGRTDGRGAPRPTTPHRLYLFEADQPALTWLPDPTRIERSPIGCAALVWQMGSGIGEAVLRAVSHRSADTPLILILPPAPDLAATRLSTIQRVVEESRPVFILPGDVDLSPATLSDILMEPPDNLAFDMVELLMWVNPQMRRIIQEFLDQSMQLLTLQGVAWFLRMSGERLEKEIDRNGLPDCGEPICLGQVLDFLVKARGVA